MMAFSRENGPSPASGRLYKCGSKKHLQNSTGDLILSSGNLLSRSLAHSHLRSCCSRPAWDLVFSFPSRTHVQRVNIILCCSAKAAVRCWINHWPRINKSAQPALDQAEDRCSDSRRRRHFNLVFVRNRAVPRAIKSLSCVGLDALGCARPQVIFTLLQCVIRSANQLWIISSAAWVLIRLS
jgi:hypothetical protein